MNVKNSDPNWKISFGRRFQKFREAIGFTQQQLAQFLGYKQPITISRWETGIRLPDFEVLSVLANKFRLNVTWLLTGEGPMFLEEQRGEDELDLFLEWLSEKKKTLTPEERYRMLGKLELCFPEFANRLKERRKQKK